MAPSEDRPQLIGVEPRRVQLEDGADAVALHDPSGIVQAGVAVSPAAWWLAAHFDGRHTLAAIAAEAKELGLDVALDDLVALAASLREAGYVLGPIHERLRREALAAYRALEVRPPTCAGGVYPARAAPLRAELDRWLATAERLEPHVPPREVRLLVAPHIDYRRGHVAYAHAYRAVAGATPELVVIFGTAHASPRRLFTLSRLDYDTPLGRVPTDGALVDALAAALGEDEVLGDELVHRDEHSCELQLPWLQHVMGDHEFRVLPVLCSSVSRVADPAAATAPFLEALRSATRGRRVLWLAAADLAHVGPRYGDDAPASPERLVRVGAQDRETLVELERGDAAAFHREACRDEETRRICGTAPIYAALLASGARAKILHHGIWSDGKDAVSYAAAAG